jgi:uncharacterized protein
MAGYVNVRAYAELNDFLGPQSRGLTVRRPFRSHQTVKDVLEAMGIPHTEVDLILVNGGAEDFAHRPTTGDRIAVYPMFEALDIGSTTRLRPVPLREPRFVIDVNLGRLARLLRVLGLDVWWSSDADDRTLADISVGQQRILLTRDRALLKRRAITHGLFVHAGVPRNHHPDHPPPRRPRRGDLRIARPQGRDHDHRSHGGLRIRPNRPGPRPTGSRGLKPSTQGCLRFWSVQVLHPTVHETRWRGENFAQFWQR